MRHLLASLFLVSVFAMPAAGQTVCAQFGAFTDCSGSNGRSSTQVDLGNNQGVIITDQTTEPYTILKPQIVDPYQALTPLPTLEPLPSTGLYEMPSAYAPIITPGFDAPVIILGE